MCLSLAGGQGWRTTAADIPLTQDVVTGYPGLGSERFHRYSVVKVVFSKALLWVFGTVLDSTRTTTQAGAYTLRSYVWPSKVTSENKLGQSQGRSPYFLV